MRWRSRSRQLGAGAGCGLQEGCLRYTRIARAGIIRLLKEKGAVVQYYDSHVPAFNYDGMTREVSLDAVLEVADCVVVVTARSAYDHVFICERAQLIVDTRHTL